MKGSILLTGVGGQGTILASSLLTRGLASAGLDVKMSEIHGMSQRGGSVSSMIRYGESVACPVIEPGTADLVVGFEQLETLRSLSYLKPGGRVIVNDERILPMSVLSGESEYPENATGIISLAATSTVVPASAMARAIGDARVANVILLGTAVVVLGLGDIDWRNVIRTSVREEFIRVNLLAFESGLSFVA